MEKTHKKYNRYIALFILVSTFIAFLTTVAPTVAFWDCGEYIASSYILGIPHPPGNPLYVLIARVFTIMFPMFSQVAYRVNLFSVVAASLTAMLIYLIIVRALISFLGIPDDKYKRIIVYLSGIVGAYFAVFNYTFWFSSVEASVYIPSMLVVTLNTWLSIVWSQSKNPDKDRYLVLFSYIAFIGIGIHMMSMLSLIPVFLFVVISDPAKGKDPRFWVTTLAMGTVIYDVSTFLWLGPLVTLFTLVMSFIEKKALKQWRLYFWIAFYALLGYSVHMYIPIRSSVEPMIDENHPVIEWKNGKVEWDAFKGFLERKQYGSESMITRMFHRLGAWSRQFGVDGHMGYGGFHITQFFHFGDSIALDRERTVFENWGPAGGAWRLLIYLIPTMLMLWAWGYMYKQNRNMAILLIMLFLIGSVMLVLYMNFADGTRAMKREYMMWLKSGKQGKLQLQHREVRIRDYFFTDGFMFFGMWMGIVVGTILHALFNSKKTFLRKQLAPILIVLFAVSPVLPLVSNYKANDRTHDWMPYDYAYNLLMSCKKNGILFTNGDNDTFPLWFLQEAEGIRRDVRIVNLSLLNTKWYIKQLKKLKPKVPISYSYNYIENRLDHTLNPFPEDTPYKMPEAGIEIVIPGRNHKRVLRIQDWMVVNIVDAAAKKKPVYFAVTVSDDNLMGLRPYLKMVGLVYELQMKPVDRRKVLDVDRTVTLLDSVYKFRGLGNGETELSETARKLMTNYGATFIQLALAVKDSISGLNSEIKKTELAIESDSTAHLDSLKNFVEVKTKDRDNAVDMIVEELDRCIKLMPWDWRPRLLSAQILSDSKRFDKALKVLDDALALDPTNAQYLRYKAQILESKGDKNGANSVLKHLSDVSPNEDPMTIYGVIIRNYVDMGEFDSAIITAKLVQSMYPGDRRVASFINQIEARKKIFEAKKAADSVAELGLEDSLKKVKS